MGRQPGHAATSRSIDHRQPRARHAVYGAAADDMLVNSGRQAAKTYQRVGVACHLIHSTTRANRSRLDYSYNSWEARPSHNPVRMSWYRADPLAPSVKPIAAAATPQRVLEIVHVPPLHVAECRIRSLKPAIACLLTASRDPLPLASGHPTDITRHSHASSAKSELRTAGWSIGDSNPDPLLVAARSSAD